MTPITGSRPLPYHPDRVAAALSDAGFVAASLDRVDELVESSPDRAVWKTKLGSGLFSTRVTVTLTVTRREPGRTLLRAVTAGAGGGGTANITLEFLPTESGTEVRHHAEVAERTGFLKIVSQSMILSAANAVIDETWPAVERKLAASA